MKKVIATLLSVLMIFANFSTLAVYANHSCPNGFDTTNFKMTGDPVTDMVNIATLQIGRTQAQIGYYEPWCDNFISDCAIWAGQESVIPQGSTVGNFLDNLLNAGATPVSTPQAGDIIIYKCTETNDYCHTALMTDSTNSIHGNVDLKVWSGPYTWYKDKFGNCYTVSFFRPNYRNKTCTIAYNANGGTGSMPSQTVIYGTNFTLANNTFTNSGKTFVGWNVHRSSDNTWFVPSIGWVNQSVIDQNGYIKASYRNQLSDVINSGWTSKSDTFTFYAIWDGCTISYNSNGGTGTMSTQHVPYWFNFTLRKNAFTKRGYSFAGWNVHRNSDNTWFVNNVGWVSDSVISSKGYVKAIYKDQLSSNIDGGWTTKTNEKFTFYAVWNLCTAHKYATSNDIYCSNCGALRTDIAATIIYNANNSTGSTITEKTANGTFYLKANIFKNPGYVFSGWTVYRPRDGKCHATGKGWFSEADIEKNGYAKSVYKGGRQFNLINDNWTTINNDTLVFYAVWELCTAHSYATANDIYCSNCSAQRTDITATIIYNANNGTGSTITEKAANGTFYLQANIFKNPGYTFLGWNVYRPRDNTCHVPGKGWLSEADIEENGYRKSTYKGGWQCDLIKENWTSVNNDTLIFYAVWEPCPHQYTDNCSSTCNTCGDMRTPPHVFDSDYDSHCNECNYVRPAMEKYVYIGAQACDNVNGDYAIRFGFDLGASGISRDDNYNTIIADDAMVTIDGQVYTLVGFGAIVALNKEIATNMNGIDVPADKLYSINDDGTVTYTVRVTGLTAGDKDNRGTPIYIKGYVKYKDGDNIKIHTTDVVCSSYNEVIAVSS